jgi:hypothetical protein
MSSGPARFLAANFDIREKRALKRGKRVIYFAIARNPS